MLHLTLLGSPQILFHGHSLTAEFATSKAQALLFYLAMMAQTDAAEPVPLSRTAVASLLWGEMTDRKAKQNLRTVLPDLRRLVGAYVQIERQTIAFDHTAAYALDVEVLRRGLTQPATDLATRQAAVDLYQGDFLSGFYVNNAPEFETWVMEQQEQLHTLVVNALFGLAQEYLKRADYPAALAASRRLLTFEPWSEPAHRLQMMLLAQTGERSAALAQYEACRQVLATEFEVAPLAETTALYEQIKQGEIAEKDRRRREEGTEGRGELKGGEQLQPDKMQIAGHSLPQQIALYGRQPELDHVRQWIVVEMARVVGICGIGGQGKTTLAASVVYELAKSTETPFQQIIWHSLLNAPPLAEVLTEWIYQLSGQTVTSLPDSLDQQLRLLLRYLREQRVLLILDNLESILQDNSLDGAYRLGHDAYNQLIRHVAEGDHASCLLFTSREQPAYFSARVCVREGGTGVRLLSLSGLPTVAGGELLQSLGLADDAGGLDALVQQYSGNPLALKLAAETVHQIFGGSIPSFLQTEAFVFDDIRHVLVQQFKRLSAVEQEMILWLSILREPVPFSTLQNLLAQPLAARVALEAVRALSRRSLLERHGDRFGLQNVVLEYATDQLIETIMAELVAIDDGLPSYLNRFGLILAQSKAYVRASQQRLFLRPLAEQLRGRLGVRGTEQRLKQWLNQLRERPLNSGYAAANILHLLLESGINVRGYDFSYLYFRQLYLRGVNLPQTNFAGAEIIESVFTEPFGIVYAAVLSPHGRFLAAGTNEGVIYIWRTADQQLERMIRAHTHAIDGLAFGEQVTATGKRQLILATASNDGRIGVWLLAEGEATGWQTYLINPDHKRLVSVSVSGRFVTAVNTEGTVFIWSIDAQSQPQLIHKFSATLTRFGLIDYSADGQLIAIGNRNGLVQIYHIHTGQLQQQWQIDIPILASLAMSRDGQQIAVGGKNGQIGLWRLSEGGIQSVGHGEGSFVRMSTAAVDRLAFSGDGQQLASTHGVGDQTVRLWSVDPHVGLQLKHTFLGHTHVVWSVAFGVSMAGEHRLVTGSSDQTVRVWDTTQGQSLYMLHGQPRALSDIALHPSEIDGEWLLTAVGYDHLVHLWRGHGDQAGGEWRTLHRSNGALYAVALNPNGRLLATAGHDRQVYLWEIDSGQLIQIFRGHTNSIYYVGFHPQKDILFSGSTDGTVRVWSLDGDDDQPLAMISAHPGILYDAAVSPDGRWLAAVGSDLCLRIWDLTQPDYPELDNLRKTVTEATERDIMSVAFSPDGGNVACGGSRVIHVWDMESGRVKYILRPQTLSILSVAYSSDGKFLASGGENGTICLWQASSGTLCYQLDGHNETVYKVIFMPNDSLLLSCGFDGAIKFWSTETGMCVSTLWVEEPYAGMNVTGVSGLTEAQKLALRDLGATIR